MLEHYLKYFELFRDHAPKHMVEWGGYQYGKPTGMASSLVSILEFAKLVRDPNCVILDAGAGASSFVLRKLFKNVVSTDPDKEYLRVVKMICRIGGVSTNSFITGVWTGIFACDYCYYDYGNIERIPTILKAIEATKYALYVDDTDTRPECKEYRDYVYSLGLNVKDCEEAKDEYGRWGTIITKG